MELSSVTMELNSVTMCDSYHKLPSNIDACIDGYHWLRQTSRLHLYYISASVNLGTKSLLNGNQWLPLTTIQSKIACTCGESYILLLVAFWSATLSLCKCGTRGWWAHFCNSHPLPAFAASMLTFTKACISYAWWSMPQWVFCADSNPLLAITCSLHVGCHPSFTITHSLHGQGCHPSFTITALTCSRVT